MKSFLGKDCTLSDLLTQILVGKLNVVGVSDGPGISGILLDCSQLRQWLCAKSCGMGGKYLSVTQVAIRLSIKQEVAYALTRNAVLPSVEVKIGRRAQRMVSEDAVQSFERTFIGSADLARQLKSSPKAVVHLLAKRGIAPVTGPNVDNCRQYFFRRSSVLELRLSE